MSHYCMQFLVSPFLFIIVSDQFHCDGFAHCHVVGDDSFMLVVMKLLVFFILQ